MLHRNDNMLVRIGCGDAGALSTEYGKPFAPIVAQTLQFEEYFPHPVHRQTPGVYSDDGEMSAANTHVLVGDFPATELGFAEAWLSEFERGGRRKGYSKGLQEVLEEVKGDAELLLRRLRSINPKTKERYNRSTQNGAAMRSVPCGAMTSIREMLDLVSLQAAITHDTPEGRFSARAVALMSHYALYKPGTLAEMGIWCRQHSLLHDSEFDFIWTRPWSGGRVVSDPGLPVSISTVWAVRDLLQNQRSLMDIMRTLITWGGDTDSVAAIAWGIASARYQDEAIPAFYERDLENGNPKTGVPYLRELGTRLMTTFG